LLRHSSYALGGNSVFEDAVEVSEVTGTEAYTVRAAGGLLFATREAARIAEDAANYPDGSRAAGPHAAGYFSSLRIRSAEIYLPG
jgi:hypothetical protein